MEVITVLAMIGTVIDDFLAILSVIGSFILFAGSFSKAPMRRYGKIADWSMAGLVFGGLFQISMAVTGTTPEKVGKLDFRWRWKKWGLLTVTLFEWKMPRLSYILIKGMLRTIRLPLKRYIVKGSKSKIFLEVPWIGKSWKTSKHVGSVMYLIKVD